MLVDEARLVYREKISYESNWKTFQPRGKNSKTKDNDRPRRRVAQNVNWSHTLQLFIKVRLYKELMTGNLTQVQCRFYHILELGKVKQQFLSNKIGKIQMRYSNIITTDVLDHLPEIAQNIWLHIVENRITINLLLDVAIAGIPFCYTETSQGDGLVYRPVVLKRHEKLDRYTGL